MLGSLLRQLLRRRRSASKAAVAPAPARAQENDGGPLREALQLYRLRRYEESIAACRLILAGTPDDPEALQLLAAALFTQGGAAEALACLRRATVIQPESADAHAALAAALAQCGEPAQAIEHYRRAVGLRPGFADAWSSLALLLDRLGQYDEAEVCARNGLRADAGHARLRQALASTLFEQGCVDEAIAEARAALRCDPGAADIHSDLVRMLNYAAGPDAGEISREHRAWGEAHARALGENAPRHRNDPDPDRRLRVGFVSPYFRKHAMTFFFESLAAHHDPRRLEMMLYADVERPDDYSERLKARVAAWRDTFGLTHEALARQVRDDRVDILVDLSGHTPRNRLLAFARRPAPVQVTWNGYPNTTGMSAMDYRVTDAICDPPGVTEHLFVETLVRLPQAFMAWQPPLDAPDPGSLPALAARRVTFGSFNSCFKITAPVVSLWARILHQVKDARLMVLTVSGNAAARRIRGLFEGHGIGPTRLELLPRLSHEDFLAAHLRADIALDTFPYHGTTTTCFSLWMGLPVVALIGVTPASRVGASLLANAGLPELVAGDGDAYVATACRLAADLPALAQARARLRATLLGSPLTDGEGGARAFEAAARGMWRAWCAQQPG